MNTYIKTFNKPDSSTKNWGLQSQVTNQKLANGIVILNGTIFTPIPELESYLDGLLPTLPEGAIANLARVNGELAKGVITKGSATVQFKDSDEVAHTYTKQIL